MPIPHSSHRQRGIALPVMLIMMLVMLVTGIYLLKSTNSTTLTAANLAYDASLSRAADLGLHEGFEWLKEKSVADKIALDGNLPDEGYSAIRQPGLNSRDDGFWDSAMTVEGPGETSVEYVIHRMCRNTGPYDGDNDCVQTAANTAILGTPVAIGESLASDAPNYAGSPQLHYVITARIQGARGGTVVNQMVVLIGV
ncbi:pilus assembly PilX family protein [Massilia arenae]|uniref:Pilus assembly protein PilX n=1 Tax=Massilia arenae TaxID=2603288 RepID=A0A5C7G4H5_9BURK|nr:hypothetical protein [Massilia arenae]TXF98521.1 hypothetical protein FVD38_16435 [Massilia arenae]